MFGGSNTSFNFGQQPTATTSATAFGTTFASPQQSSTTFGGNIFGGQTANITGTPQQQQSSSLFGQPTSTPIATATGQPQQTGGIGGFNFSSPTNTFGIGFNQPQQQLVTTQSSSSGFAFGSTAQPTAFSFASPTQQQQLQQPTVAVQPTVSSIISPQTNQPSLFGGQPAINTSAPTSSSSFLSGGLFGTKTTATSATVGFSNFGTTSFGLNLGNANTAAVASQPQPQQSVLFGQPLTSTTSSTFGVPTTSTVSGSTILGTNQPTTSIGGGGGGIFGAAASTAPSTAGPLSFGGTTSFSRSSIITTTSLPTSGFGFASTTTPATIAPAVSKPFLYPASGIPAITQIQTTTPAAATTSASTFGSSLLTATTTTNTTTSTSATGAVSGFNFGSSQTSNTATTAAAAANPSISKSLFGTTAATTTTTAATTTTASISFGLNSSATITTTSASSSSITAKPNTGFVITPLSSSTTTAAGTATATTTTTITSAPITTATVSSSTAVASTPAQLTFGQLEDQINIWMNELTQFEVDFHEQSQTINSWDSLLISNGQKLIEMDKMIEKLNVSHRGLDHQLDFIIAQQKELEQLLEQVEDNKLDLGANNVNAEREHTYSLIETVHNDLNAIGADLKDFIKKLNETKSTNHDADDPMIRILKILNSHMDVLQWMENQIKNIKVN
ncbi:FG-nucleoporin nsp1 [Dermatophagoides farinae]|uniref:FG-nucleoporin nsp1 n=1 Tax=Dermatophagoides farinae TaxID=6954 RepID=A0A922I548_DERFA|nr:FG-nucleoporin nsp1 [Dermatophagoides farinae]